MSRATTRARRALGALLLAPLLAGAKCIPYDPELAPGGAGGAGGGGGGVPCDEPQTAYLQVRDYSFPIACGCAEAPWPEGAEDGSKTCTVATGTKVQWVFTGSRTHQIVALVDAFGPSGLQRQGTFEYTFGRGGVYSYGCALHASMRGYDIVVVDPE